MQFLFIIIKNGQISYCLAFILLPGDVAVSRSWGNLGVLVELHCRLNLGRMCLGWEGRYFSMKRVSFLVSEAKEVSICSFLCLWETSFNCMWLHSSLTVSCYLGNFLDKDTQGVMSGSWNIFKNLTRRGILIWITPIWCCEQSVTCCIYFCCWVLLKVFLPFDG